MKVNNKTFEQHKMRVYSFSYQPLSMSSVVFKGDIGLNIVHNKFETNAKQMNLICLFRNKLDISKFIQNITENVPSLIDIGDCFRYESYYQGSTSPVNEIWNGYYKVTFPFLVIQQSKTMKKITLRSMQNKIINSGTYECPCIIEITPSVDFQQITIGDYIINDLKANQKFVIDGIKKKVYDHTGNRFNNVEFKNNRFPFLKTGINQMNISTFENITVIIKYREFYI